MNFDEFLLSMASNVKLVSEDEHRYDVRVHYRLHIYIILFLVNCMASDSMYRFNYA